MRQPPDVLTSSIGPGSGSAPSPVSNTPMSDSEPRMSARMVTETRSGPRVSTNTTWSISSALPASSHALDADSVRNWRAARCRLAGSAVALRNSRSSTSGSMPGVGLGRLGGAGRSTVPMACGADELGTPAQPASSDQRSSRHDRRGRASHAFSAPVRVRWPERRGLAFGAQRVSSAAGWWSPCGRAPAAASAGSTRPCRARPTPPAGPGAGGRPRC